MKHLSAGIKVGILVLIMAAGTYAVWKSIGGKASGSDNYVLWAKFRDASGLPKGSATVVAGLPVGEIEDLGIEGRHAKVDMRIRDDIVVWSNAVAYKKSASLLGSYYIEIDPGSEKSLDGAGREVTNTRLGNGDQIKLVVEATSPDQLLRRIEESMPKVDSVLISVRDLSEDVRQIVRGPLANIAGRVDQLVQEESQTVKDILQRTDRTIARIEDISKDIRNITAGADDKVNRILDNLDDASQEAKTLVTSARNEVEQTGAAVRGKLDRFDSFIDNSSEVARKINSPDEGTLGKLVNDPAIADNVEEITDDARGFLGTLFGMQTYVGLRSEYNFMGGGVNSYITVDINTRPDKFYYVEFEKGPRGDFPEVVLTGDGSGDTYTRSVKIEDKIRFTFQFGKRLGPLAFRFGIKESTGGVGVDMYWFNDRLRLNLDLFDPDFDRYPRFKVTAAYQMFRYLYVLGGVDDAFNSPQTFTITPTPFDGPPTQFNEYHYGRDYFLGAQLRFNDKDLSALLFIGGAAIAAATQ
ncbi:MAG TPA: MlaD family protein [Kofleriaceae bacterium]|nr:MlaD family protein [Kofleriaceae bacterium]